MMTPPVRATGPAMKSLVSKRLDAIRQTLKTIAISMKETDREYVCRKDSVPYLPCFNYNGWFPSTPGLEAVQRYTETECGTNLFVMPELGGTRTGSERAEERNQERYAHVAYDPAHYGIRKHGVARIPDDDRKTYIESRGSGRSYRREGTEPPA